MTDFDRSPQGEPSLQDAEYHEIVKRVRPFLYNAELYGVHVAKIAKKKLSVAEAAAVSNANKTYVRALGRKEHRID